MLTVVATCLKAILILKEVLLPVVQTLAVTFVLTKNTTKQSYQHTIINFLHFHRSINHIKFLRLQKSKSGITIV